MVLDVRGVFGVLTLLGFVVTGFAAGHVRCGGAFGAAFPAFAPATTIRSPPRFALDVRCFFVYLFIAIKIIATAGGLQVRIVLVVDFAITVIRGGLCRRGFSIVTFALAARPTAATAATAAFAFFRIAIVGRAFAAGWWLVFFVASLGGEFIVAELQARFQVLIAGGEKFGFGADLVTLRVGDYFGTFRVAAFLRQLAATTAAATATAAAATARPFFFIRAIARRFGWAGVFFFIGSRFVILDGQLQWRLGFEQFLFRIRERAIRSAIV